jgi:predicted DNA-binding protein
VNPRNKRLAVDLNLQMHNRLKEIAIKHNVPMSDLVKELIESLINYENKIDNEGLHE